MQLQFSTKLTATLAASSIFVSQILTPQPLLAAQLPFQQYNTASDIPQKMFQQHVSIYGSVERITDGDTLRIRHIPMYPFQKSSNYDGKLSENTIPIRLYAIDAPEIGKYGNPSMPFAEDAKDWLSDKAKGKVVKVKLLRRDQYNRVVGKVTTKRNFIPSFISRQDLSLGLARNGFATLYTGGGAEYDDNLPKLKKEIERAKVKRLGLWRNGSDGVMNPSEYKRMMKSKPQFVPVG